MRTQVLILLSSLSQLLSQAQVMPTQQLTYFQQRAYYGQHQQFYTLKTYLPDSTLYRLDNFQLVEAPGHKKHRFPQLKGAVPQGPTTIMYPNGKVYLNCSYEQGDLNGPLTLFYSDGSLKRREVYKQGQLQQSQCYSPRGEKQFCQPLYQAPQFMGDYQELNQYLVTNLQPVVQPQLQELTVEISVNEVGQVTQVTISSPSTSTEMRVGTAAVIERLTHWLPDGLSWLPARMDGVPLAEKVIIHMKRERGLLRTYTPNPKRSGQL